ncbi:hypothetical protein KY285_009879 [Solanum tuberosum]|nr:hypothetical protein KY285_009879 [Solanum tuberosum]
MREPKVNIDKAICVSIRAFKPFSSCEWARMSQMFSIYYHLIEYALIMLGEQMVLVISDSIVDQSFQWEPTPLGGGARASANF